MKAIAVCNKGLEAYCAQELKAILHTKLSMLDRIILFESDLVSIALYAYRSQVAKRVLLLLGHIGHHGNLEEALENLIKNIDFSPYFINGVTFCVRTDKLDYKIYPSQEIEQLAGELIFTKTQATVSLKDPGLLIRIIVTPGDIFITLDTAKEELTKRDYKIFAGSDPFNASTSAAFALFSGFNAKKSCLDISCGAGLLVIESALIATNRSPHYFRKEKFLFPQWTWSGVDWNKKFELWDKKINSAKPKLQAIDTQNVHVEATKKNAKIAGVIKSLIIARIDIEWLDTKFNKSSIDLVMSMLHFPATSLNKIEAWISKSSHQAAYILKPGGIITLLTKYPSQAKLLVSKQGFKLCNEVQFFQGDDCWTALAWENTKSDYKNA